MSTTLGARERPILLEVTAARDLSNDSFTDWESDAACRDIVTWPNIFAPTTPAEEAAARSVCATCQVTYECLILGLTDRGNSRYLYGGLTSLQRVALTITPQIEHDIAQMERALDAAQPWNQF
ncbi:MAG: WhiB family transcriptional regulator [Candidatus Saccharibacteria bacterium]|nr:WhiB family transcriptional regulator [Candidatus Saccharibacteria bacterium]